MLVLLLLFLFVHVYVNVNVCVCSVFMCKRREFNIWCNHDLFNFECIK